MSHVEELERLLDTFQDSADHVLQLKHEKEQLESEVDRMQTENNVADAITALQDTTERLQETSEKQQTYIHHVKTTADTDEVELADPNTPEEDNPELHAPNDAPNSDVPAWHGYDPDTIDKDNDPDRLHQLEHENNMLKSALNETQDVMKRLQRRAEELADDDEPSSD